MTILTSKYDLIVAGGGLSGTAAAIAASRGGASVLLIEQGGALGGAAINCLVNPFMPYWTNVGEGDKKHRFDLSRGIFEEITDGLKKLGAIKGITFHEEYLKFLLDRMTAEAGVKVLFHASLDSAEVTGRKITSVTAATKAGKLRFEADYFIDATGDADLSNLSGCSVRLGREKDNLCQPMTLCFRAANVDKEKYHLNSSAVNALYKEYQKNGKIKNPREDILIFDTLVDGVLHFNSTRIVRHNPVDPFDVSRAEAEAREQVYELFSFMKENAPGFENAQLLYSASAIGVRESRMVDGLHILNEAELKDCVKFPDSIAAGNYDIDIHNPEGSGTSHYYFPEGVYYTIPYSCLVPLGKDNLLTAGRCVSATHEAQASIRIMPICCCLGEAAGTAAAVAVKNHRSFPENDISEIQRILRSNGAFIG